MFNFLAIVINSWNWIRYWKKCLALKWIILRCKSDQLVVAIFCIELLCTVTSSVITTQSPQKLSSWTEANITTFGLLHSAHCTVTAGSASIISGSSFGSAGSMKSDGFRISVSSSDGTGAAAVLTSGVSSTLYHIQWTHIMHV